MPCLFSVSPTVFGQHFLQKLYPISISMDRVDESLFASCFSFGFFFLMSFFALMVAQSVSTSLHLSVDFQLLRYHVFGLLDRMNMKLYAKY